MPSLNAATALALGQLNFWGGVESGAIPGLIGSTSERSTGEAYLERDKPRK